MNDSVLKTLTVSFLVCLFCSLVVSYAAVSLRDMQNLNKLNDQRIKILKTAAIYNPDETIEAQFSNLTPKFVDFSSGELFDSYGEYDLDTYDPVYFSKQPEHSTPIPASEDIAIVKNKENIGKITIIDARSKDEFDGTIPRAARGGHIPTAINIDWNNNLEQELFKSDEQLSNLYKMDKETQIVTYCQGAYRAANSFLALKKIGFKNVKVYLGSWGEWGNNLELPVE